MKRPRGRPLLYTPELAAEICERMSGGETLQSICRDDHMPAVRTVNHWTEADDCRPPEVPPTFAADFAQARARGEDAIAADCLRIADTPMEGVETTTDDKGTTSEKRGDMLGHRKLQIETRLKLLAKWNPKRYGDKLELAGDQQNPLTVVVRRLTDGEK